MNRFYTNVLSVLVTGSSAALSAEAYFPELPAKKQNATRLLSTKKIFALAIETLLKRPKNPNVVIGRIPTPLSLGFMKRQEELFKK